MKADGLKVTGQPVPVKVWERGNETFTMVSPAQRTLGVLGLGGTAAVRDRIVLFDVPFTTYPETVQYRGRGASAAAMAVVAYTLAESL